MSLQTDKFFYRAIMTDSGIDTEVGGRIYSTAVPVPDEELDNVPVPYIVIENGGTHNNDGTKDDMGEGDTDIDTVSVLVVASDRDALASLAEAVRKRIRTAWEEADDSVLEGLSFDIADYRFSSSPVAMDVQKPCVFQTLTYICETIN